LGHLEKVQEVHVADLASATSNEVTVYLFEKNWNNMARVEFRGVVVGGIVQTGIDNIVVTAVPLPPAVLLLSSAIAMLAFVRLRSAYAAV